ncbi:hypothetical protein C8R46DRAFT_913052 [Mycena filopes]|nr:hypothetical protein C8R46DRAFT_913052 [Mycena filopes]
MILKSYLELDPEKRPAWAFLTDKLIAKYDKKGSKVQKGSHVNTFLQKWSPKTNELPRFVRDMLTCAKKYGVVFDTPDPSNELKKLLPLWHHHGENPELRQLNNKPQSKCLRKNHGVTTIGQGMAIMARLTTITHRADAKCICNACIDDRLEKKCKNPHKCAVAVKDRLTQILPKWNPLTPTLRNDEPASVTGQDEVFRTPPEISKLSEGFRIFSKDKKGSESNVENEPEAPPIEPLPLAPAENEISVVLGVHVEHAGQADAKSGAGIWYSPDDPRNESISLPASLSQTAQNAEVIAALICVQKTPDDIPLRLTVTGSTIPVIVNKNLQNLEDRGWIGVRDKLPIQALATHLRRRQAKTTFVKPTGGTKMMASELAKRGAQSDTPSIIKLDISRITRGVKLSALTQAMAYKGIKELRSTPARKPQI